MTAPTASFEHELRRVEACLARIEQSTDVAAREAARETVRLLLGVHAAGLGKIVQLISLRSDEQRSLLDDCLADDLVRSLLLLHDLHPDSLETRVLRALESTRPFLNSHGGDVELVELSGGTVRLALRGNCHGCPSSTATLRNRVEGAIREQAPDVTGIEIVSADEPPKSAGFVELSALAAGGSLPDDQRVAPLT